MSPIERQAPKIIEWTLTSVIDGEVNEVLLYYTVTIFSHCLSYMSLEMWNGNVYITRWRFTV